MDEPKVLVDCDWLAARLGDPDLVVVDATTHTLPPPPEPYAIVSGRADFERSHIPGARFVDIQAELSAQQAKRYFTLPTPEGFAQAMARLGVGDETLVVCYSTANHWWATRLWWLLGVYGHDKACVLDGGLQQWIAQARELEAGAGRARPRAKFTPRYREERVANKEDVLAAIADRTACIVNALPAESHRGEGGTDYGRPGHIAGSLNVPAAQLIAADNRYKSEDELRRLLAAPLASPSIIAYCGGGISATSPALALALLGRRDVRVYPGSLSEWAPDTTLPMAVGP